MCDILPHSFSSCLSLRIQVGPLPRERKQIEYLWDHMLSFLYVSPESEPNSTPLAEYSICQQNITAILKHDDVKFVSPKRADTIPNLSFEGPDVGADEILALVGRKDDELFPIRGLSKREIVVRARVKEVFLRCGFLRSARLMTF